MPIARSIYGGQRAIWTPQGGGGSEAAYWPNGTVTAASNSQADVQAAINSAANGQVVVIPDGSVGWSSGVTVSGKYLLVKSATHLGAKITHNAGSGNLFNIARHASGYQGLKDIEFIAGTGSGGRYFDISGSKSNKISFVYENKFDADTANIHQGRYQANGLVFYNNIVTCNDTTNGNILGIFQINPDSAGDSEWAAAHTIGTADTDGTANSYFEDNTFTLCLQQSTDGSNGAKVVFRHNAMIDSACVMHGNDTDGFGGGRHFEYYDNTFSRVSNSVPINRWMYIRGGTGVITDNVIPEASSPDGFSYPGKPEIDLTIQSLRRNAGPYACYTGAHPVPHQIGQSTDSPDATPDFPVAIWNNTGAGTGSGNFITLGDFSPDECGGGPAVSTYVQLGRDYITTAPASYAKYPYPHPLRPT